MKLAANMKNIFSGRVIGLGMGRQAFAGSGLVAILCMQAFAGPEGEQVVNGSAQFSRNGLNTVIRASNNTIIDYRSFNIAANESVQFVQPNAASRVLNRVPNSVDPTRIDGSLRANGIVYIVNSAGVYFGSRSVVNVAGLYAAAGNVTNADFLNNVNHFTNLTGTVSNAGTINAGAVALIGKQAENLGTINAERGLVTMAAGDEVYIGEVGGNFMVQVAGAGEASGTGVNNAGTINAPGGTVRLAAGDMYSLALKMPGRIVARDVKLEAAGRGTAIVSGTIDASGQRPGERGGDVQVLGDRVGIVGATIDASGPAGGGTVLIGGDFQGRGDVQTASRTTITKDSTIKADATDHGDAGKVIVWSDEITRYYGDISAKGGANGGDGGFVEVSGKQLLDFNGGISTRAVAGTDGTILLDPQDIVIQQAASGGPNGDGQVADSSILFADGGGGVTFTIGEAALEALTGDITLQADRDITVESDVTLDLVNQGDTETVTFQAGRNITVDGTITTSGADIVFSANDAGGTQADGSIFINNTISTAGANGVAGDISLQIDGGTGSVQIGGNLLTDGGNITIADPIVITADNLSLDTEQGDDDVAGNIDFSLATLSAEAANPSTYSLTLNTGVAGGTAGAISLGTVNNAGGGFLNDLTLNAGGTTAGRIDLFGNIAIDTNAADLSSLSMTGSGVVLNANVTIDTEAGNDGAAGTVNLSGAPVSAAAAGFDLTIHTQSGGGNGGAVTLGSFNDTLGTAFVRDVNIDTDGTADGALTLRGDVLIDGSGGNNADFNLAGGGNVLINRASAGQLLIDTEQGDNADAGNIDLGASRLSGAAAAQDVGFNVSTAFGGGTAGIVTFGGMDSSGGSFLNDVAFTLTGANAGRVNIGGTINLNASGADTSSLAFTGGGNAVFTATTTIITAQPGQAGGSINFGTSEISASGAGIDLTLNTSSATTGGAITLGSLGNFGGAFINDLSLSTIGFVTGGVITLTGDILLDANGGDLVAFSATGGEFAVGAASVTIDTEQGDDDDGGTVNLLGVTVVGNAAGRDLAINTSTASANGGAVTMGLVGNGSQSFLNDLLIATGGGTTAGAVTLSNNVSLDNNAGDVGDFTLSGNGLVLTTATLTIDTEQGNDGDGGAVDLGTGALTTTAFGRDFTINTATTSGGAGGAVSLGSVSGAGGGFLNDLIITTSGTGAGVLTLNGNISLDSNGADLSSVAVTGAPIELGASVTIDTEQGNDGSAGTVDFGAGGISANSAGRDLTINTATTFATGAGGAVTLGTFDNAGGSFVNDTSITRAGGASGTNGAVTLNGDISLDNNVGDAGNFAVTDAGNIVLPANRTIDTEQGDNGPAGAISMASASIFVGAAGRDLTLDASTLDGASNGGDVALPAIGITGAALNDLTVHAGGGAAGGTVSLPATIQLNGSADTGDLTITGASAISLAGDTTIDTDAAGGALAAGNVAFPSTATINGNNSLTIDTTADGGGLAGAINLLSTIGDSTRLTNLTLTGATIDLGETHVSGNVALTADDIDFTGGAASIDSNGVAGEMTIQPTTAATSIRVGASGAGTLVLDATDVAAIDAFAGGVTIGRADGTSLINIGTAAFNTDTTFLQGGVGGAIAVVPAAAVTTAGNSDLNFTAGSGDAGSFTQGAGATINTGAGAISILSDAIELLGGNNTISTTSTITLRTVTAGRTIVIGAAGTAADFALDDAEIAAFTDGSAGIAFGDMNASNPVTIDQVTFNDPLSVLVPMTGGDITIAGNLTGAGNASITLEGDGSSIRLEADVSTTDNSDITFDDDVVVVGTRTVSITGPGIGGNILFTGTINADMVGADTLALSSVAGAITLQSNVGNSARLGGISFDADSTVSIDGNISITGGGDVNFATTPNIVFADATTIDTDLLGGATNGGDILFDPASMINVGAPGGLFFIATADGGGVSGNVTLGTVGNVGPNRPTTLLVQGQVVTLNGNVTTAGQTTIGLAAGTVVLGADVVIDNTAGTNNQITIRNVSGNQALSLIGDAGSLITLSNADVDALTLTGGPLVLGGTIETDTAQDYSNVGAILLESDTTLLAQDSDSANAPQDITTDAGNSITGAFALTVTGNNVSLASIGDMTTDPTQLTVTGAGNVTFGEVSVGSATISADSDMNNAGTLTFSSGETFRVAGGALNLTAADIVLEGNLNAASSAVRIERSADGTIGLGDSTGDMTINKDELANIAATTLVIGGPTKSVDITVENVEDSDFGSVTGFFELDATGNGASITFENAASSFRNLNARADDGIQINADVSTTLGDMRFDADADDAADTSDALSIAAGRTLDSAGPLTLSATTGDISGGGMITLRAVEGVTINDSFNAGGALTINSDSDLNGVGAVTIATGAAVATGGSDLAVTASDLVMDGSINAGAGSVSLSRSTLGTIRLGGTAGMGEFGISGAELQAIMATGLDIGGNLTNLIEVEGITAVQSAGITGITQLNATADDGRIRFVSGASTFTTLSASADDGIDVDQDLSTTTGDLSLNANSDGADDSDDSLNVGQDADLTAGNDLLAFAAQIELTGSAGSTNIFTSGSDGNVSVSTINAPSSANLTINSQNNVTLGTTDLNAGTLTVVADSDADAVASIATAGINAGVVDLGGGSDNNDTIDLNLAVTGANGITIHNAAAVNIPGNVIINSPMGNISVVNSVTGVVLTGADGAPTTFSSGSGVISLAPVTSTNNPDLTITTDGGAVLSIIDLNTGDLVINAGVTPPTATNISFSAGSITLGDSIVTMGTDITLDGPVILTGPVTLDTGAGPGNITLNSSVRSDSDDTKRNLTLSAGTGNITAASSIGDGGAIDELLILSANNATFAGNTSANSIRQVLGSGTSTFQGTLISQGAGGIDLDGNAFVFQGAVVTTSQGAGFSLTNTGAADFQSTSNIALAGALLQDGTGAVNLAANVTTSLAPISFAGPVTIPAAISISNNGAGDITFAGTLTTTQPVTIDGSSNGTGNINFNGAVASTGELNARTGTGAVTFASSVTANSAVTAQTSSGAITFNGPLSVVGALSASSTSGVISFASTVTAGTVFSASTQSANIQFGGAVNGSAAGNGNFSISAGTGDVIFNSGANVGGTNAVNRFVATGRNITVQGIRTQGTAAAGDGDISLTPDLTVTQNQVTEFPGQIETDNRPNGVVRINGDLVANNGDINLGAAGRSVIPSVATTIVGNINFAGGTLPTFTIAANSGNVNIGAFDKLTAFGNLSLVGINVAFSDAAVLGVLSVNAGDNITLRQRPGALLLRPAPDGMSFIRNQVDFGSNIVANGGIGFAADNVVFSGSGGLPSFASSNGVGTGLPPQTLLAIRTPFAAADLRVGDVALGIDARGTTDTGLATALASAIPRDTDLGTVTDVTSLGQAEKAQLRELRINPRELSDAEMLDFLSGRSLYEDIVLDPNAVPDDYLVSVNRLPSEQVERVLVAYRLVFKKPRLDPDTGEQMSDPNTGKLLFEDRDREIRDELAGSLRRFRKEGREGTLDPIEFRRYLELSREETVALGYVEALQDFFEQLHLLGLGPKEEDNSKRTLLGRVCPSGMRVQQLEQTVMAKTEVTELE